MKDDFLTYRNFNSLIEVEEILDILKQNDIIYIIEDNTLDVPSIIVGETSIADIKLKIKQSDFKRAGVIINSFIESSIGSIDENYHILSFTDDELFEIINKKDEWNPYDYNVAKIELKKRGIEINEKLENAIQTTRLKELKFEEKGSTVWIIFGYLSSMFGGLLGIAIGLSLCISKRTLPTGERVYIFNSKARLNGIYITILGIIIFLISMIFTISKL